MSNTNYYALIIGVGGDLCATINDANALAQILRDPSKCNYAPKQVCVLLESDATKVQILTELVV